MKPVARWLAALAPIALSACSPAGAPAEDARPPLEGARLGGPFALTDQHGRRVTERDFAGRWRIMYFGYTFCPDVCPVDVQNIGAGLRAFEAQDPARGRGVVPVFVTIDPARDTPAVLKQFVANFHPRMVGLTGTADEIAGIAKAHAVYYAKGEGTGDNYLMDHSRQAMLFDPAGRPIAILPTEKGPAPVTEALARWVK